MDFKVEMGIVLVFFLSLVFGPLLVFAPRLAAAKRVGLREYGTLAERYVREFDTKWLRGGAPSDEQLVGSGDVQSRQHRRRPGRPLLRHPDEEGVPGGRDRRSSSATGRTTRSAGASSSRTRRWATSRRPTRRAYARDPRELRATGTTSRPSTAASACARPATASAASSRKALLTILQERCRELGVELEFETRGQRRRRGCREARPRRRRRRREQRGARRSYAEHFKPDDRLAQVQVLLARHRPAARRVHVRLQGDEHGLFQVHAYPFEKGRSTFIVECHEETWKRAGLDQRERGGHGRVLRGALRRRTSTGTGCSRTARIWRTFPTVAQRALAPRNVVLLGDAAHTAHFSIGSGTKLAMEDSIALADALPAQRDGDVPRGARRLRGGAPASTCSTTQRAAQTSLEWFENSARYTAADPLQFTFNLMTRSKRITYDNLAQRDPALVAARDASGSRERSGRAARRARRRRRRRCSRRSRCAG